LREVRLRRVDLLAQEYVYEFLLKKNQEELQQKTEIERFQEGLSTLSLIKVSQKSTMAELEVSEAILRSLKDTVQPTAAKTARVRPDKVKDPD